PLSRVAGEIRSVDSFPGIQPDLLPAVHPGLSRDAAPVLAIPAGVPGPERAFNCRFHDFGGRLRSANDLFPVVDALRQNRRRESLGAAGLEWKAASPPPVTN